MNRGPIPRDFVLQRQSYLNRSPSSPLSASSRSGSPSFHQQRPDSPSICIPSFTPIASLPRPLSPMVGSDSEGYNSDADVATTSVTTAAAASAAVTGSALGGRASGATTTVDNNQPSAFAPVKPALRADSGGGAAPSPEKRMKPRASVDLMDSDEENRLVVSPRKASSAEALQSTDKTKRDGVVVAAISSDGDDLGLKSADDISGHHVVGKPEKASAMSGGAGGLLPKSISPMDTEERRKWMGSVAAAGGGDRLRTEKLKRGGGGGGGATSGADSTCDSIGSGGGGDNEFQTKNSRKSLPESAAGLAAATPGGASTVPRILINGVIGDLSSSAVASVESSATAAENGLKFARSNGLALSSAPQSPNNRDSEQPTFAAGVGVVQNNHVLDRRHRGGDEVQRRNSIDTNSMSNNNNHSEHNNRPVTASAVVAADDGEQTRRHNLNVRSQLYKEVRRPGMNHSLLFRCLLDLRGSVDVRLTYVRNTINEALRFKRLKLAQQLEQYAAQLQQQRNHNVVAAVNNNVATNNKASSWFAGDSQVGGGGGSSVRGGGGGAAGGHSSLNHSIERLSKRV